MIILFIIIEFLSGSFMFSYWLGLLWKKDLRKVGDGNPGAFNLWEAAGYKLGILGIFLDFMKGYLLLALLVKGGYVRGWTILPAAIAPILGHIFSPFMKFKGGKGIAVSFGVWSAVTRFHVSIVYAVILAVLKIAEITFKRRTSIPTEVDGLMVTDGMALLGIYLIAKEYPSYIIILWLANLLLLIYTNKDKLYKLWCQAPLWKSSSKNI